VEQVFLEALTREEIGKTKVKVLRDGGFVPGVLYGRGREVMHLKIHAKEFHGILRSRGRGNLILNLRVLRDDKPDERTVLVKEIQYHPVTDDILHVDFNQISLTEKIVVNVPVILVGEAAGVKEGGLVEHSLWQVEIESLPARIPEKLNLDIAALKIGEALRVKDILLPEGVSMRTDPELCVVAVVQPKAEVVEEVKPGEEITEPEVIKQKKPLPEEEAEESQKGAKKKEEK
jgi:large subunit ribosomal protein L25